MHLSLRDSTIFRLPSSAVAEYDEGFINKINNYITPLNYVYYIIFYASNAISSHRNYTISILCNSIFYYKSCWQVHDERGRTQISNGI